MHIYHIYAITIIDRVHMRLCSCVPSHSDAGRGMWENMIGASPSQGSPRHVDDFEIQFLGRKGGTVVFAHGPKNPKNQKKQNHQTDP